LNSVYKTTQKKAKLSQIRDRSSSQQICDSEALRRNRSLIIQQISDSLTSPKDGKNSHVHKLLDTYNTD